MVKKKNKIKALPYSVYFYTALLLGVSGLLISAYLSFSHYWVYTDIGYRSFCAITRSINCDTVSQSPYSILWGIPVPLWGLFAYAFLLLMLYFSTFSPTQPKRLWSIIQLVAITYVLMSLFFAYLSTYYIRSYCILCIAIYAINLLVLFYTRVIRRRFDIDTFFQALKKDFQFIASFKKKAFSLIFPLLAFAFLIWVFLPAYWKIPAPPLSEDISTGVTQEGHPWIGSMRPELTIVEFSDYQCFQCNKMHHFIRTLIQENADKIRLVHRHFPMDHRFNPLLKEPFHVGSGEMALMAIYAATQNKFWPVNDLLFEIGRQKRTFNTKEIGEKTDLDFRALAQARKDPAILIRLQRDIIDGIKLGIQGTPAFLIDGKVYTGQIPSEIIENALK